MGKSKGQARLNFIKALSDADSGMEDDMFSIGQTHKKMNKASGTGRFFGGVGGGLFASVLLDAIMPGAGQALRTAAFAGGTGIGSRVGSEIGERSVDGRKEMRDQMFRKDVIDRQNKEYSDYYKDFDSNQNTAALSDTFTAALGANMSGIPAAWAETGKGPLELLKTAKTASLESGQGTFKTFGEFLKPYQDKAYAPGLMDLFGFGGK